MKYFLYFFLFLSSFNQFLFAQSGTWAWINGDNYIGAPARFGTQGIPDVQNCPPSVYEPCDWQDKDGNFWIFGGYHHGPHTDSTAGNHNTLWKYSPADNTWTWVKGPGHANGNAVWGILRTPAQSNIPAARGWGTLSWTGKDGKFWLYSGSAGYNDLWRYDPGSNEWTWMHGDSIRHAYGTRPVHGILGVASPLNTPGTRDETSASWTDKEGNLWLFGGRGFESIHGSGVYNDLWKFDTSINQWIWMHGPNHADDRGHYGIKGLPSLLNRPSSRQAYAKWKDSEGNLYLFGGFTFVFGLGCNLQGHNDVWKFDLRLKNWIWIDGDSTINSAGNYSAVCSANSSYPRNSMENRATCFDRFNNAFMFGNLGVTCNNYTNSSNELWHFNSLFNEWSLIRPDGLVYWGNKGSGTSLTMPPKTFGSVAWLRNGEVWVFGGSDYGNYSSYNSMWKFTPDANCLTTKIQLPASENEISLFPNPATNHIKILFPHNTTGKLSLSIFNILGQTVYESLEENAESGQIKEINIHPFANSIYTVLINLNDRIKKMTFIKTGSF